MIYINTFLQCFWCVNFFLILEHSMYLFSCTMLRFDVNYGSSEQQVMVVALEENNYSIQDI